MNTESKHHLFILAALSIAMFPHLVWLPAWIIFWCILFFVYSFQVSRGKWRRPKPGVRQLLTVSGFLAVLVIFGLRIDRESCVGLLAVMSGLKVLEIKTDRDRFISVFLAYFIVLSNLLYSDSLAMTFYMLLSVSVTTGALITLTDREGRVSDHLRLSVRMMIQAFPIMLVCFFLFPRLQGGLWGIAGGSTAKIGFSDTLAPGDISKIVRNDDVAFRATFHDPLPKPDRLYWRGLVLWHFDGKTWQRGIRVPYRQEPAHGSEAVSYTVSLEPHGKRWRFALDIPISAPPFAILLDDQTLISRRNVRKRISYALKSYTVYRTGPLKLWEEIGRQLPVHENPKAVALAKSWASSLKTPKEIVRTAIDYLRENSFTYTLDPPLLRASNRIDDFLFKTRRGYCEHFASAFAFLMRAAEIPARVVVGYLGGEKNPFANYLIVRQSDAHAWVEVWLPTEGWMRVDPTTAVAPQRIEQGMIAALPEGERPAYLKFTSLAPIFRSWKKIEWVWDATNVHWNRWVIGYTRNRQKQIFFKLGIGATSLTDIFKTMLYILGAIGIFAILFLAGRRIPGGGQKDVVQEAYGRFCRKLSRIGIERKPAQGPLDFARHVKQTRKDLAVEANDITQLYIELRYGRGAGKAASQKLKSMVGNFKPGKKVLTSH